MLCGILRAGVLLDSWRLRWELIGTRGCELFYLPPYSPDLNPIEEAFAKVEAVPR